MFIHIQMDQPDLTVNITIKKSSDDSIIVDNQSMVSLGHGLYKYNFSVRNPQEQYYYFCTDSNNKIVPGVIAQNPTIIVTANLSEAEHNKLMSLVNTPLGTLERKVKMLLALMPSLQGLRR